MIVAQRESHAKGEGYYFTWPADPEAGVLRRPVARKESVH
jgi:hypothetical protein